MQHDHSAAGLPKQSSGKLISAVIVTFGFATIEYVTGIVTGSLALKADAGHMVVDSMSLVVALVSALIATKTANERYTFGFSKIQIPAAIINILLIVLIIFHIGADAIQRFSDPVSVSATGMLPVAILGLIVNVAVFFLLHDKNANTNIRAAQLHVLGDMLGSIGAIIGALLIIAFGWQWIDPLISVGICLMLLSMTVKLSKRVANDAIDGVPEGIDVPAVSATILSVDPSLKRIHDLHIWKSCDKYISLTAHVETNRLNTDWNDILFRIHQALKMHGIEHVTIQPEALGGYCDIHTEKPEKHQ